MKQITKVSIGNIAFTLEEDAYCLINQYLEDLKQYYKGTNNGDEIVENIEERMAELLSEKIVNESIVNLRIAQEVTDTLGKPEGFDVKEKEMNKTGGQSTRKTKKLFRDKDNAVLGGICSGLGIYLNISPVLLRLIFALGALIGFPFFVPGYLILWIVIPAAKTVEQKYAMKGESPTVSDIEKNIKEIGETIGQKAREIGTETQGIWMRLGYIISKCIGLIFILIAVFGLFILCVLFWGFQINGFHYSDLKELYLIFSYLSPELLLLMKITLILTVSIPIIGFLYSGIKLFFGFKTPKLKIGVILSIIWLLSFLCAISLTIISVYPYKNHSTVVNNDFFNEKRDTIYIKYVDSEKWQNGTAYVEGNSYEYSVLYSGYFNDNYKLIFYPTVKLNRKSEQDAFYLETRCTLFPQVLSLREINKIHKTEFYCFEEDTLFLYPAVYTKDDKVKEILQEIKLHIEDSTIVIVTTPIEHQFKNGFNYNNIIEMKVKNKSIISKFLFGTRLINYKCTK